MAPPAAPAPAVAVAPPRQRSQRAADALLAAPTLSEKLAAKRRRSSLSSTNNAVAAGAGASSSRGRPNPHNPYAPRSVGGSSAKKRPFASGIRGKNHVVGGFIGGDNDVGRRRRPPTTGNGNDNGKPNTNSSKRSNCATSASAFERRNGRDRISKKEAPPTDTDRTLLAMLDGRHVRRKKPNASTSSAAAAARGGLVANRAPATRRRELETTASSDKRRRMIRDGLASIAIAAPPPPPSYGRGRDVDEKIEGSSSSSSAARLHSATAAAKKKNGPRKRASSHTTYLKKEVRKRKPATWDGGDDGGDFARAFGEKRKLAGATGEGDRAAGKKDGRFGDRDGGGVEGGKGMVRGGVAGKKDGGGASIQRDSAGVVVGDDAVTTTAMTTTTDAPSDGTTRRDATKARVARTVATPAADDEGGPAKGSGRVNPNRRRSSPSESEVTANADRTAERVPMRKEGEGATDARAAGAAATSVADDKGGPAKGRGRNNPYRRGSSPPESEVTANAGRTGECVPVRREGEGASSSTPRGDERLGAASENNSTATATACRRKVGEGTIVATTAPAVNTNAHESRADLGITVTPATTSFDDALPDDEELMALPLLGIGAKRRTAKGKPPRGRLFGGPSSSSSTGRNFCDHGRGGRKVGRAEKDVSEATPADGSVRDSSGRTESDEQQTGGATDRDPSKEEKDANASHETDDDGFDPDDDDDGDFVTKNAQPSQHAEWYDPEEHAAIQKNAEEQKGAGDGTKSSSRGSRKSKSVADINENFVRQDLRNAAGSCRGARNLKKANKQKLWRAQHRFGMSDPAGNDDRGDGGGGNPSDIGAMDQNRPRFQGSKYQKGRGGSSGGGANGGDAKCFASARNAGVDPLDDFVDGAFSKEAEKVEEEEGGEGVKKCVPVARKREDGVPLCTRHQRPCKLLTVKRNNKGNKGRKFYVCPMPRGEQCDFFKWEEDTVEATQRALLKSSSSSGFIARQVAASRTRFKELTVPELRIEAKKRGLKPTGKKDQILTRLLIWVRDEIADSVEPNASEMDREPITESCSNDVGDVTEGTGENDPDSVSTPNKNDGEGSIDPGDEREGPTKATAAATTEFIELSDDDYDESSYDDDATDDDESSCDELEICRESSEKPQAPKKSSAPRNSGSDLHDSLSRYFGHADFREGQEWAIRRTLSNKKTLLVAPTGQGKSLCYALPAALMDGICLVVSPLISLMQDQLRQLPPKIPAATLSGSMTTSQMALIVDDILRGRYKVLFVSPERLASAAFRRLVRPKYNIETGKYERQFPTVSLLCVDEAHCLSQWGHNFRPSYLRVRSLLPLIEPKSILALTATAGPMVVRDICNTLCIPFDGCILGREVNLQSNEVPLEVSSSDNHKDGNGVKVLNCNRDNIDVFSLVLQNNDERRYLLHKILKEKKKGNSERSKKLPIEEGCLSKGSVIVYVWRQKDTEIVAEQLNGAGISGGVVCYHGGMDSNGRSRAQSKFMRGKARICVATVAFGLGINKPDIQGVIHLCLPPSPEHYLQEIGRAGRDGRPAKAIALPLAEEFATRHSLAHSDRLSRNQIDIIFSGLRALVDEALGDIPPEAGIDLNAERIFIDGMHIAMPVRHTVDASDCKEESIETIFSLLEGGSEGGNMSSDPSLLSVEGYLPDAATITLKRRSLDKLEKMEQIAKSISICGTRVDGPNNERSNNEEYTATNSKPYNRYQGNFGGTAMEKGFYAYSYGTYKFSIVRCARCMGPNIEPRHVYAALRRLQGNGELELVLDTTTNGRAMHLRMKQDGIHLFRTRGGGSGSDQALDGADVSDGVGAIVSKLSTQFSAKEKASVGKVESMYDIIHQVSCRKNDEGDDPNDEENDESAETIKSPRLILFQKLVQNYFRNGSVAKESYEQPAAPPPTCETASTKAPDVIKDFPLRNMRLLTCLSSDVSLLMQALTQRRQEQMMPVAVRIKEPKCADYRDLCVAKILHSIDAPRAPIFEWYSHVLWGKYRNYSFSSVVRAVKKTFVYA